MVLNAILIFFLGLVAFIFMQYDTFYDRQKQTAEMVKSAELSQGLEAVRAKSMRKGMSFDQQSEDLTHNNPVRLLSFMKNSSEGEKALYHVVETQFTSTGDTMAAKSKFKSLNQDDQYAAIKMALVTSDRSRISSAVPTVLFLISPELIQKYKKEFIELVLNMEVLEIQRSLLERVLPYLEPQDKEIILARINGSELPKERKTVLDTMISKSFSEGQ